LTRLQEFVVVLLLVVVPGGREAGVLVGRLLVLQVWRVAKRSGGKSVVRVWNQVKV
jgi:hypothetical protein